MQKHLLLCIVILFFATGLTAQTDCNQIPAAETSIQANRLRVGKLRIGPFIDAGVNGSHPGEVYADYDGYTKPGHGFSYMAFWAAGIDTTGKKQASMDINRKGGNRFHLVAGPFGAENCADWDRFWTVERPALTAHHNDLADGVLDTPLPEIMAWPGRGNPYFQDIHGFALPEGALAPFFDANADSIYNPYDGDFPHPENVDTSLMPGSIIWNIARDLTGLQPMPYDDIVGMGLQYQTTVWATHCTDTSVINNSVFFAVKVQNKSQQVYDSMRVGVAIYPHLFKNDFFLNMGTNPELQTIYSTIYKSDNSYYNFPPFWGRHPAVGWVALNRPFANTIPLLYSSLCCVAGPVNFSKSINGIYYPLHGQYSAEIPITNQEYGYSTTWDSSQIRPYFLSENINDPEAWHGFSEPSHCSRLIIGSFEIGKFHPDQTETFEYAFTYSRDTSLDAIGNTNLLFSKIAQLKEVYQNRFAETCEQNALCEAPDCVWPGDANNDGIVNLHDLLPVALSFGQSGIERSEPVLWQPISANNWPADLDSLNLKYADCNGDAFIDTADVAIIRAFYGETKPSYIAPADVYRDGLQLYLKTTSSLNQFNVQPNQVFGISPKIANDLNIKALAFEVEFDTAYFEFFNVDPIKFSYCYISSNANGSSRYTKSSRTYIKVEDEPLKNNFGGFPLLSKVIPPDFPKETAVKIKNIKAYNMSNEEVFPGSWDLKFCFGGGCATGQNAPNAAEAQIFPDPADDQLQILVPDGNIQQVELIDMAGSKVLEQSFSGNTENVRLDVSALATGIYVARIQTGNGVFLKKILVLR